MAEFTERVAVADAQEKRFAFGCTQLANGNMDGAAPRSPFDRLASYLHR